jgi:hypothetical protein
MAIVTERTVGIAIGIPPMRRTSRLSIPVRYLRCWIGNMTRISTNIPIAIEQMQKFPIAFKTCNINQNNHGDILLTVYSKNN